MDEATKSRLEETQAEIKLGTGKKVTQQEILSRLIRSAIELLCSSPVVFDDAVQV